MLTDGKRSEYLIILSLLVLGVNLIQKVEADGLIPIPLGPKPVMGGFVINETVVADSDAKVDRDQEPKKMGYAAINLNVEREQPASPAQRSDTGNGEKSAPPKAQVLAQTKPEILVESGEIKKVTLNDTKEPAKKPVLAIKNVTATLVETNSTANNSANAIQYSFGLMIATALPITLYIL